MSYGESKYLVENYLGILIAIYIFIPMISGAIYFAKSYRIIDNKILKRVIIFTYFALSIFFIMGASMNNEIFDTLDDYFRKKHGTISSVNELQKLFDGVLDDLKNEKYSKNDTFLKGFSKDETLERVKVDGDMYIHTHTTKSIVLLKIFEILFSLIFLFIPYLLWRINDKLFCE